MTDLPIYLHERLDAQMALWALDMRFTVTQPRMAEEPFHSRTWVIGAQVPNGPLSTMSIVQAIVNRYDGEIHQEA